MPPSSAAPQTFTSLPTSQTGTQGPSPASVPAPPSIFGSGFPSQTPSSPPSLAPSPISTPSPTKPPTLSPTVPQAFYTRKPTPTTAAPSLPTGSPSLCPLIHPTRIPSLPPLSTSGPTVPQAFYTPKPIPTTAAPSLPTGSPSLCPLIHPTRIPSSLSLASAAPSMMHLQFTVGPSAPPSGHSNSSAYFGDAVVLNQVVVKSIEYYGAPGLIFFGLIMIIYYYRKRLKFIICNESPQQDGGSPELLRLNLSPEQSNRIEYSDVLDKSSGADSFLWNARNLRKAYTDSYREGDDELDSLDSFRSLPV